MFSSMSTLTSSSISISDKMKANFRPSIIFNPSFVVFAVNNSNSVSSYWNINCIKFKISCLSSIAKASFFSEADASTVIANKGRPSPPIAKNPAVNVIPAKTNPTCLLKSAIPNRHLSSMDISFRLVTLDLIQYIILYLYKPSRLNLPSPATDKAGRPVCGLVKFLCFTE